MAFLNLKAATIKTYLLENAGWLLNTERHKEGYYVKKKKIIRQNKLSLTLRNFYKSACELEMKFYPTDMLYEENGKKNIYI